MALRGERPPIGLTWIVTWPLSAAFAALVFLAAEEMRNPAQQPVAAPSPITTSTAEWSKHFPDRIAAVDAALRKAPLKLPKPIEEPRGSGRLRWMHRLYQIDLKPDEKADAEAAINALRGVDPGVTASAVNTADGTDVRVGLDGLLVSTLRFRWVTEATPEPAKPRLVVIVGPLGDDLRLARQIVEIDAPIVLAVTPFRPFSREVAELGRLFTREVLVQLNGNESVTPEDDAPSEFDAALASVPQAVGVAWPGGSADDTLAGRRLLAEIDKRRLLYVGTHPRADSGTVGALPAPEMIDDKTPEALVAELTALLDKARTEGGAIAYSRPSETTLTTLAQVLPEWRAADIEVVPVSALESAVNLSAR